MHFCGHHKALQRSQLNSINDTLVKKEHFNSLGFIEALRMTGKQFAGLNMPPAELNFPRHNPGDETGSKEMMLCNDEKAFVQFMDSAGPDQPAHLHRRWGSTFVVHLQNPLQKHTYLNIKKISSPKTENFEIKNSDIFHISAQNIDCGYSLEPPRRGGSNEYPQSMFLSRNKKIMYTPVNPSCTI